jgi:MarR-like DNA-binding transcriptional regulator SgrR of sgrS sRNA
MIVLLLMNQPASSRKEVQRPFRTALFGPQMTVFDPVGINEYNEITFISQICGRLTAVDEAITVEGDLSSGWEISDKGLRYEFTLKPQRVFADGSPVTAKDVAYTFQRVSSTESVAASWNESVKSVAILAENRIRVDLHFANPNFLYILSHPRYCVLNHQRPFYKIGHSEVPNSSGAYQVEEIGQKSIRLKVTDPYFKKAIEKQIDVYFLSQDEAVKAFASGELDDLSFYLLSDKEIESVKADARVLKTEFYWTWFMNLNPSRKIFSDGASRREFLRNFNLETLYSSADWKDSVRRTHSVVPTGMISAFSFVWNSNEKVEVRETPRACKEVLQVVIIEGMPVQDHLQKLLESEISKASGCETVAKVLDMKNWMLDQANKTSDIYVSGLDTNSTDPLGFYRYFVSKSSENLVGHSSPAFDAQYNSLLHQNPKERTKEDFERLEQTFRAAGFGIGLGQPEFRFVYGRSVSNVHMNPLGMHLNRWWKIGREG